LTTCDIYIYNITTDINIGCKVNVNHEPPEDGLVKVETYVGVKEQKVKKQCICWCVICELFGYIMQVAGWCRD
jgi:hypothetical protein